MSPVDEGVYAALMAPRSALWRARAAEGGGERRVRYAVGRAEACARPYRKRLAACGRRGQRVKCGCPGWRGVKLYTCRQHLLCPVCKAARAKRMSARMRAGIEAELAGRERGTKIVLLTLTVRHSGDVGADREALAEGWRRFYRRCNKEWGRYPYVGVWEVTPGADGAGHVHVHIAAIWPWRDWGVCRQWWLDACPQSERITFVAKRRDGQESSPKSVARYLGKYMSKGMEGSEFSPVLRANIVGKLYNTRWVFSSRKFWVPFEPRCPACQQRVVSAQYRWHGAPWKPDSDGCDSPRGSPQLGLPLSDPNERPGGGCSR